MHNSFSPGKDDGTISVWFIALLDTLLNLCLELRSKQHKNKNTFLPLMPTDSDIKQIAP